MMNTAEQLKQDGNDAFKAKNYEKAIECFTKAIESAETEDKDTTVHIYYSNRSAAHLASGNASAALKDGQTCISRAPSFAKGYSRAGAALFRLGSYKEALAIYNTGITKCDSSTAALVQAKQETEKAMSSSFKSIMLADKGVPLLLYVLRVFTIISFWLNILYSSFYYYQLFKASIVSSAIHILKTYGRPAFTKEYGYSVLTDATSHTILYSILMILSSSPSAIVTIPVVLTDGLHVAFVTYCLVKDSHASLISQLTKTADEVFFNKIQKPRNNIGRFEFLYKEVMPMQTSVLQVYIGIYLILAMFITRDFLKTILYWQYLRMTYALSPSSQKAFSAINYQIKSSVTCHPKCPAIVSKAYLKLTSVLESMANPSANNNRTSKCNIM